MSKRKHFLVPNQKVMSKDAVEALLGKMNLNLNNLPKILVTDPQLKDSGAKAGDVMEIEREDLGRKNIYYRLVVSES